MAQRDCWAEWLAERRYGGDDNAQREGLQQLLGFRDGVLDNTKLSGGETVLDVGCGEGLIGFGALDRGAGNPRIPTIAEAMDQALSAEERKLLENHLRPLVEEGRGTWRMASAFLHAVKP